MKKGYVLTPEKLDQYVRRRLFPEGASIDFIRHQEGVHLHLATLPSELERRLQEEGIEAERIHQTNPREAIYNDGRNTYVALSGGISRMQRYLDMKRWVEECVAQMPQYRGTNIRFQHHYYNDSCEDTFARFNQLDWELIKEVMSHKEFIEGLIGVLFNSVRIVREAFTNAGVSSSDFYRGEGWLAKEYLAYQFIRLPRGVVLNFDYSYGSQVGSIMEKLAKSIHRRVEEHEIDGRTITFGLFGKAGGLAPNLGLGALVAPNGYIANRRLIEVENQLTKSQLSEDLVIGPNLPQRSVIKQKLGELEEGRRRGAIMVEMEMKDAVAAIEHIRNWGWLEDARFMYGVVISDLPLRGLTIEQEDIEQEEVGLIRVLKGMLKVFDKG
ncbi:hypothetical protein DRJ48_04645 [Candidatus Woesearchaeota archaeon]|nr:hypothetical protein [Candidatus Woesearchaeota archaeon]RLE41910.1 MAG: hypothetical protein DRJ48_04645 [Candidatus Woesearchaeota archaeon]